MKSMLRAKEEKPSVKKKVFEKEKEKIEKENLY